MSVPIPSTTLKQGYKHWDHREGIEEGRKVVVILSRKKRKWQLLLRSSVRSLSCQESAPLSGLIKSPFEFGSKHSTHSPARFRRWKMRCPDVTLGLN